MFFRRAGLIGFLLLGGLIGCSPIRPSHPITPTITITPAASPFPIAPLAPTLVPTSLSLITPANAAQLIEIARLGHGGIARLSISPHDQTLALIGYNAYSSLGVWLYDAATLQPLHLFEHVQDISWSPDGTRLALQEMTLSPNGYEYTPDTRHIQVWSVKPPRQLFVVDGYGVTWSPDGQRLATRDRDHKLSVWDAAAGQRLDQIPFDVRDISNFVWSPNGQQIAIIGHQIEVLDVTQAQPGRMLVPADNLQLIGWSPDNSLIVGSWVKASSISVVRLYRAGDTQSLQDLVSDTRDPLESITWSPDSTWLALSHAGSADGLYRRAANGQFSRQLDIPLNAAAWSPDGQQVALASRNGLEIRHSSDLKIEHGLTPNTNVLGLGWLANDQLMSFAGVPLQLRIWDTSTGRVLRTSEALSTYCSRLSWSPDSTRLAFIGDSGSTFTAEGGSAVIWDAVTGHWLHTFPSHNPCRDQKVVDWSPDGRQLLTGDTDQRLRVWDVASGQLQQVLDGPWEEIVSVAWSATGDPLVSARSKGTDQSFTIWDATSGQQLKSSNLDSLDTRAWSPDGQRYSNGTTIRDEKTGQDIFTFTGSGIGGGAAWSPDGRLLATLDSLDADIVKLWNTTTGQAVAEFRFAPTLIVDLAWSPDGTRLALGSTDGAIRSSDGGRND